MKKLDKQSFTTKVASLKQAISVQGKVYHSIRVTGDKVKFIRGDKPNEESINLSELYDLYVNVSNPTNQEARAYISGRVQSPAVSIINALGNTNNITSAKADPIKIVRTVVDPTRSIYAPTQELGDEKDEMKFFTALSEVLGRQWLLSKSIGKPISSSDVFLSDNFLNYGLPKSIEKKFEALLKGLKSNFSFSSKSLSHFIDGLLVKHPVLGSRIVEFDEEQHFTPALKDALAIQEHAIGHIFYKTYQQLLQDLKYLNEQVFKKHRIKHHSRIYPESFQELVLALQKEKVSGYIKSIQNGFPYVGGRMAQRAYYDCLRNAAHLSPKNTGLEPILRFPKKFFEDVSGRKFSKIEREDLKKMIAQYLSEVYNLRLSE